MVAKKRKSRASNNNGRQPTSRVPKVITRVMGLDDNAKRYAALLSDPCNADLTYPVYSGSTSGYLVRLKQFLTAGGNSNAVDSYTAFCPTFSADGTITEAYRMIAAGYSSNTGGSLGTIVGYGAMPFLNSSVVGHYRPVAGCLKVHYTGSELNRSGIIHLSVGPPSIIGGETGVGSVTSFIPNTAKSVRLGSEPHEVKWFPASTSDEGFTSANQPGDQGGAWLTGTALMLYVVGAPAGSVQIEVDFIFEWTPNPDANIQMSFRAPPSTNTTAQVIKALGDAAGGMLEWSTTPHGRRIIGSVGRGVYNVMTRGAQALLAPGSGTGRLASSMARLALTM